MTLSVLISLIAPLALVASCLKGFSCAVRNEGKKFKVMIETDHLRHWNLLQKNLIFPQTLLGSRTKGKGKGGPASFPLTNITASNWQNLIHSQNPRCKEVWEI